MDLGDQRTCGINYPQTARLAHLADLRGHPMSAINYPGAGGNLFHAIHKNRALCGQFIHHIPVVNYFLAHINRCTEGLESYADDVDSSNYPSAEPPWLEQKDSFFGCDGHAPIQYSRKPNSLIIRYEDGTRRVNLNARRCAN